jgi:hypothetical protein
MLIHHTDCGMLTFSDAELKDAIHAETGIRPSRLKPSPIWRGMSVSRSRGSRPAPSSRTRIRSGASCTTWRPASCGRWHDREPEQRRGLGSRRRPARLRQASSRGRTRGCRERSCRRR